MITKPIQIHHKYFHLAKRHTLGMNLTRLLLSVKHLEFLLLYFSGFMDLSM